MHDHRLQTLLKAADTAAPPSALAPTALAAQVRSLHDRRRRRALGASVAASVLLLAAGVWRSHTAELAGLSQAPAAAVTSADAAATSESESVTDQIQTAEAEIERSRQIVARLLAAERLARAEAQGRRSPSWPSALLPASENSDRAAGAIMLAAQHKQHLPQLADSVHRDYQLVVDLFPSTAEAIHARDRLMNTNLQHMP